MFLVIANLVMSYKIMLLKDLLAVLFLKISPYAPNALYIAITKIKEKK
jgi:hypothetical protein